MCPSFCFSLILVQLQLFLNLNCGNREYTLCCNFIYSPSSLDSTDIFKVHVSSRWGKVEGIPQQRAEWKHALLHHQCSTSKVCRCIPAVILLAAVITGGYSTWQHGCWFELWLDEGRELHHTFTIHTHGSWLFFHGSLLIWRKSHEKSRASKNYMP